VPGGPTALPAAVRTVERPEYPRVRAFAFGSPRVECDGRQLSGAEFESGKAMDLLFFLLAAGGDVTADQVVEALWPESSPARGQSNLYSTVYRLRRALHPDALTRRRGSYALNAELPLWEDSGEFERLVNQAERATSDERLDLLTRAAELYRGPYLADRYAEWCEQRRTLLEGRYLYTLAELVGLARGRGDPHLALDYAQRILAADPYHEDANAWVIELSGLLGDRNAGIRHYQRYAELLREELDEEPGTRVQAAYRVLLRGTRALA
jgi:two-component SAPR family response regulator